MTAPADATRPSVLIIGPALFSRGRGNRRTAMRWAGILEKLGCTVRLAESYTGQDCDLLVALHAIVSADSIERFHDDRPERPIVLALTGTDVYGIGEMFDRDAQRRSHEAMARAARLVGLNAAVEHNVPEHLRPKVTVISQSALPPPVPPVVREDLFEVCVVGELREVKDPFRAALAARRLPSASRLRVVHAGAAGSEQIAARAAKEEQVNPRYAWLGEISPDEAIMLIARSRALLITSRHEGGPNVLTEALAVGTPILASRIPGIVGLLGEAYPGYFDVGDTEALSELLHRIETDADFLQALVGHCAELAELASPAREAESWRQLLQPLLGIQFSGT